MKSKESEYKELFLIEAKENIENLDQLFVELEKDHKNLEAINAIFRITHTLKGNAMGLGFEAVAELSHLMEDVMNAIKIKEIALGKKLFEILFRANDKLGALVRALETGEKISYLGVKTSLSVYLKNERNENSGPESGTEDGPGSDSQPEEMAEEDQNEDDSKEETSTQIAFSDVIQIPIKKMDELMNEVGQLLIEKDRLVSHAEGLGLKTSEFDRLQRITSNLQYSIMNARMVQVGFLFNKFHRVLRDAASIEKKQVNLVLKGTDTEIDRNILKVISDSLVHLVRNSVSHGIEAANVRKESGKPAIGTVTLNAKYERDRVVITVQDDGGGIDHEIIRRKITEKGLVNEDVAYSLKKEEIIRYIFESGFSNTESVNELSGRGVGMDVVKRAVESIGGQVRVDTRVGAGTSINLHLPSSLALKGTLLFEVNGQEYAIALSYTEAVVSIPKKEIYKLSSGLMAKFQNEATSMIFLSDLLQMKKLSEISQRGILHRTFDAVDDNQVLDVIIVSYTGFTTGLIVDKVIQQKEIIEKPLVRPVSKIKLLSGTTILGNGSVCPIIDVAVITDLVFKQQTLQAQTKP